MAALRAISIAFVAAPKGTAIPFAAAPKETVHSVRGALKPIAIVILAAFALGCATPGAGPAAGLDAPRPPERAPASHHFVAFDHWSRGVLRRLALDGDVGAGIATAAWPLTESIVANALDASRGEGSASRDTASVARTWNAAAPGPSRSPYARRFHDERRGTPRTGGLDVVARTALRWRGREDPLRAGSAVRTPAGFDDPPPVRLRDESAVIAAAQVDADASFAALRLTVAAGEGPVESVETGDASVVLGESFLTGGIGVVRAWVGRRGVSMGSTGRGGIVLGDAVAFDGGGIETPAGFRLPGFLGGLGEVRVAQTVARMRRSGDVRRPWFIATRLSFAPSSRLAVGLSRAALFGGEGNEPVNARRVLLMLVGLTDVGGKDSDFENQVASADVYWRVPARFPLAAYAEYGTDDAGRAFLEVPALIVGLEASPRAGSRWSATFEHVRFEPRGGTTYPKWYRHGALGEGWTDRGEPLGWPLGGHGRETSLALRIDAPDRGWLATLRLSARHRGAENLFAPDRAGDASAAALDVVWFASRGLRIVLAAEGEHGERWDAGAVTVTGGYSF